MSRDLVKEIDEWRRRQPDLPNKNEAIRRLIDFALRQQDVEEIEQP